MKKQNYQILMVAAIAAIVLMPLASGRAAWQYLGCYVPNNPTYDSDGDGSTYFWEYSFSASTSAGSGGVSASGTCNARTWTSVHASQEGPTDMSRYADASCSTWGESYFADFDPPNWFSVSWSVSGNGNVYCSGAVDDDYCTGSTDAGSSAASGTDADDGYGYGGAGGSAWTRDELGSADVGWGGDAVEGDWHATPSLGGYEASLAFSVDGSGSWETEDPYFTQYTAEASVYADSSSSASASVSQGVAYAGSRSDGHFSGTSSMEVSY
jgi:hypothetical protein